MSVFDEAMRTYAEVHRLAGLAESCWDRLTAAYDPSLTLTDPGPTTILAVFEAVIRRHRATGPALDPRDP